MATGRSHSLLCFAVPLLVAAHACAAHAEALSLQRTYLGAATADQFGFSASAIGDVNRDGRADFIVGANANDAGATSGGRIFVYLGGNIYPSSPALRFDGTLPNGQAGGAVSGGADLDHDGYDDWIVGAPGGGLAGTDPGRVYVFRGAATPDSLPEIVLQGTVPGGAFGAAVLAVRDLDGDGFGDLVVGAPRAGNGRVYVYRGGPVLDATPDRIVHARAGDERFGASLSSLPDTNGDGRDDLLVGVPRSSQAATWAGAVLLYRGTADLDTIPDLVLLGGAAGDEFGTSLAAGFDVSGDGAPDVVVGAPFANPGGLVDAGRAYVFRAGAAFDATADLVVAGSAASEHFGSSVSMGFDWDGDGANDLAVGVPDRNAGFAGAGAVLVYRGGAALDATSDATLTGSAADQHLGAMLAGTGDVRHNGRRTLLVCGYGSVDAGRALLYGTNGAPTDAPTPAVTARLSPPVPNPFNPAAALRLDVGVRGTWVVDVVDASGRRVRTLWAGALGEGAHTLRWDGRDDAGRAQASGVYFVRARSRAAELATRAVLVR